MNRCLVPLLRSVLNYRVCSGGMASEIEKAQSAKPDENNVFAKIIRKEIPTTFIYEDDQCVAFNDVCPQAPVHFLVLPKKSIHKLDAAMDDDENVSLKLKFSSLY